MEVVKARQINVRGVVQGVGFRPFIFHIARQNNLTGYVFNTSGDVTILVEGSTESIERFLHELRDKTPPQARIESIVAEDRPVSNCERFEIRQSLAKENDYQLVSPDLATCPDCKAEIFNPSDRRYGYPFTNCTNCGPRFTIIEDIPYDRPRTTMKKFRMCPLCQKEYDEPADRRFHAQPNACPVCGPELEITDAGGSPLSVPNVIAHAGMLLKTGKILAVKGLGGFLLACDATNVKTVQLLRERKKRPAKPFAIMVKDIEQAKRYCYVSRKEAELLASTASPIVLLETNHQGDPLHGVAPGLGDLGVMLPYTPVHHLLLEQAGLPLVMTSGNLSEEPIAKDNSEALERLKEIADYFLLHNRDIYSRYDDSVVLVEEDSTQVIRRARGYAPYPIHLPLSSRAVLACGAELKNTFCLTRENHAFVSQHVGDMENRETLEHFENTLQIYQKMFRIKPEIIACDMHPDYLPTQWAENEAKGKGLPLVKVQHHHAHIVSCLADNGLQNPVIGVAFDGTGYGTDGRIWGGEFVVADYRGFKRAAHLEYLPLPGGNAAIAKPYRAAIGYLYVLFGKYPCFKGVDPVEIDLIRQQVDSGLNTPLTSSAGRLFDVVSSLLGIRQVVSYEGQAAAELEAIASDNRDGGLYPFRLEVGDGTKIIRLKELFEAIINDLKNNVPVSLISAKFHQTIARLIGDISFLLSTETGIKLVALSGGVFQNSLLFKLAVKELEKRNLKPLFHKQVPCNDGGVSLGQAVVANFNF